MLSQILNFHDSILQDVNLKSFNAFFFCGIGGIGMSALALMANDLGYNVLGSNNVENDNTKKLKSLGIQVFIGHDEKNIPLNKNILFIHTSAVKENNIEYQFAKNDNIKIINRGTFLSILSKEYFTITIAGSHGKTTTTSMISDTLMNLNLDPTSVCGGIINSINSNARVGRSKYFVVESDESDGTFISIDTKIGIITNVDLEHMDFYKTKENLLAYFTYFAKVSVANSGLIICSESKMAMDIIKNFSKEKIFTYGFDKNSDIYATNIRYNNSGMIFDIIDQKTKEKHLDFYLKMYGEHNILNALAAICVTKLLKIDVNESKMAISKFAGVQKRFNFIGKLLNLDLFDDYAHNPQKIECAINSITQYLQNLQKQNSSKIIVIFEPHRFTRIKNSINEFASCFQKADYIIITDIYSAGENLIEEINQDFIIKNISKYSKDIVKCNSNSKDIYINIAKIIIDNKIDSGVVLFVGAGQSSNFCKEIFYKYGEKL